MLEGQESRWGPDEDAQTCSMRCAVQHVNTERQRGLAGLAVGAWRARARARARGRGRGRASAKSDGHRSVRARPEARVVEVEIDWLVRSTPNFQGIR